MGEVTIEKLLEAADGTVILSLSQPEPWDGVGLMDRLEKQIADYVRAIGSGAITQTFPKYEGRPFEIRIMSHSDVPEQSVQRLTQIRDILKSKGIGFHLMQINVNPDDRRTDPIKEHLGKTLKRFLRLEK
jgi:hypothetical protein